LNIDMAACRGPLITGKQRRRTRNSINFPRNGWQISVLRKENKETREGIDTLFRPRDLEG
jgi:hypothetical protein